MNTKPYDSAMPCGDSLGFYGGLTKREYIAAMAMAGLCANPTASGNKERMAEASLMMADALIAELNKEEK